MFDPVHVSTAAAPHRPTVCSSSAALRCDTPGLGLWQRAEGRHRVRHDYTLLRTSSSPRFRTTESHCTLRSVPHIGTRLWVGEQMEDGLYHPVRENRCRTATRSPWMSIQGILTESRPEPLGCRLATTYQSGSAAASSRTPSRNKLNMRLLVWNSSRIAARRLDRRSPMT